MVPAPTNFGFETAGGSPGQAAGWTVTEVSSASELAVYGAASSVETFSAGWANDAYLFAFDLDIDTEAAAYDAAGLMPAPRVETFERGWNSNETYSFVLGASEDASFDTVPQAFEDFEEGWGNDAYLSVFDLGIDTTIAEYGTGLEDFESFENGWSNDSYMTSFNLAVDTVAASYDGAYPQLFEDFEQVRQDAEILSVDASTETFTAVDSGLWANTESFYFVNRNGGALPGNIASAQIFYSLLAAPNAFQISLTFNGPTYLISSAGDQGLGAIADPTRYWGGAFIATSF